MVQDEMHPRSQSSLGTAWHIKKKGIRIFTQSKGGYAYFTIKRGLPRLCNVLQQTMNSLMAKH